MPGDYVAPFGELLSRAEKGTPYMWGAPLTLTSEQRADILKLNEFRNDLEHVKPGTRVLKVGGLPRLCANVATACGSLLVSFAHQLEEEEIEQVTHPCPSLRPDSSPTFGPTPDDEEPRPPSRLPGDRGLTG